jgi:TIR domain
VSSPIFISHSSSDQKVAETICDALQSRGYSCWISSRDIGPGENFQESIVKAIRSAKLMLLVFTSNANNSNEIKKEIVLAGRYHLTVVPVRVEDVVPNDALAYEFATRQWIDLFRDWERDIERLASQIGSILADGSRSGDKDAPVGERPVPQAPVVKKPPARRLALLALPVLALVIGGASMYWRMAVSPPLHTPVAASDSSAEDQAWTSATNVGTIESFKRYLEEFPNGNRAAEAQQRIRAIDDKAWADAFAAGTIVALNRYKAQFPEGAHIAQAQRSIAGLERQAADQGHSADKTQFDGAWLTTISCSDAGGAQGYTFQFPSQVKDGKFHGQRGADGQPNWMTIDGAIQLDGSADLFVQGIISDPAFAVGGGGKGTKYAYHFLTRFESAGATGNRVELRPCSFTAVKQ